MKKKFGGVTTALITPFLRGKIDLTSVQRLVERQIVAVDGLVLHGTTGESPTTSDAEKKEVFDLTKSIAPIGFPLIVGTGTNSTSTSILNAKMAEQWGADAVLVVVPYYNKPPQRGMFEHFVAIANATSIPVILYNVPGRTGVGLELDTIKKLSEHPNIVGIKEASGKVDFAKQIRQACGDSFLLLSGDDATYGKFMEAGGDGVISVASHIIPNEMKQQKIEENLELIDFLFVESNPIPVKAALQLMGTIRSMELRPPLCELSPGHLKKLKALLEKKELLK